MDSSEIRRHAARDLIRLAIENHKIDRALSAAGSLTFLRDIIDFLGVSDLLAQIAYLQEKVADPESSGVRHLADALRSCAHALEETPSELRSQLSMRLVNDSSDLCRRLLRASQRGKDELAIRPSSLNSAIVEQRGIRIHKISDKVECAAISSDGSWAIVGVGGPNLDAIDLHSGSRLYTLRNMSGSATSLELLEGCRIAIARCDDGTIWSWDLSTKLGQSIPLQVEDADSRIYYNSPQGVAITRDWIVASPTDSHKPLGIVPRTGRKLPDGLRALLRTERVSNLHGSQQLVAVASGLPDMEKQLAIFDCASEVIISKESAKIDVVHVSPSARYVVFGDAKQLILRDVMRDASIQLAEDPSDNWGEFIHIAFSFHEQYLVVTKGDARDWSRDSFCLYDVLSGELIGHLTGITRAPKSISGSSNVPRVIVGDLYGGLAVFDLDQLLGRSLNPIGAVSLNHSGDLAVASSVNGPVHLWNSDGTLKQELQLKEPISGITFVGEDLVTVSSNEEAQIWDLQQVCVKRTFSLRAVPEFVWFVGDPLREMEQLTGSSLSFSRQSNVIIVTMNNPRRGRYLQFCGVSDIVNKMSQHDRDAFEAAITFWTGTIVLGTVSNSRSLMIGCFTGETRIWNIDTGQLTDHFTIPPLSSGLMALHDVTTVVKLATSSDGDLVIACPGHLPSSDYFFGGWEFLQVVWCRSKRKFLALKRQQDHVITALDFVSNGTRVFQGTRSTLSMWNIADQEIVWTRTTTDTVAAAFALADDQRALALYLSGKVEVISLQDGLPLTSLSLAIAVSCGAMNEHRDRLVVGDDYGNVMFLDVT